MNQKLREPSHMEPKIKRKGQLYLYVSYMPGAGKTYRMLQDIEKEKDLGKRVYLGHIFGKHRETSRVEEMYKDSDIFYFYLRESQEIGETHLSTL